MAQQTFTPTAGVTTHADAEAVINANANDAENRLTDLNNSKVSKDANGNTTLADVDIEGNAHIDGDLTTADQDLSEAEAVGNVGQYDERYDAKRQQLFNIGQVADGLQFNSLAYKNNTVSTLIGPSGLKIQSTGSSGASWGRISLADHPVSFSNTGAKFPAMNKFCFAGVLSPFITAADVGHVEFRILFGVLTNNSAPPAFGNDALSNTGWGVIITKVGSLFKIKIVAHNGTTYSSSAQVTLNGGNAGIPIVLEKVGSDISIYQTNHFGKPVDETAIITAPIAPTTNLFERNIEMQLVTDQSSIQSFIELRGNYKLNFINP